MRCSWLTVMGVFWVSFEGCWMVLGVVTRAGLLACSPLLSFDLFDTRDRTEEHPKYSEGDTCIEESKMGEQRGVLRMSVVVS